MHMGHLSLLCRALKRGQSCYQMPEYFTGVLRVSVYLKNKSGVSGPELTTKKKKKLQRWFFDSGFFSHVYDLQNVIKKNDGCCCQCKWPY